MSQTELRRIHRDSIEAIEEAQIRLSAAQNERVVVHQEDHVLAGMHELISSGYQICDAGSITAVIKEPSVCVLRTRCPLQHQAVHGLWSFMSDKIIEAIRDDLEQCCINEKSCKTKTGGVGNPGTPFTAEEVKAFISFFVESFNYTGEVCDHVRSGEWLGYFVQGGAVKTFSHERYNAFTRYLDFITTNYQTLATIYNKNVVDNVCNLSQCYYYSFDESMATFTGHCDHAMTIVRKPNPDGFPVYTLACETPVYKKTLPVAIFPRTDVQCTPSWAFREAISFIQQCQRERKMPIPVVVIADSLFGSVKTCETYHPNVLFIFSARKTKDIHLDVLTHGIKKGESRCIAKQNHIISVYSDNDIVVNISSVHRIPNLIPRNLDISAHEEMGCTDLKPIPLKISSYPRYKCSQRTS